MNQVRDLSTMRRIGRETLVGSVVVFLLFGPYLSQFLRVGGCLDGYKKGRNALWFLWQPHDIYILLGGMLAIVAAAVVCREILRQTKWQGPLRLFDHAFVLALGAGILANVWFHAQRPSGYRIGQYGMETQTAWVLLFGLTGYSLASPGSRLVCWCVCACRIISPAILIVVYQLLCLPTLTQRMDPLQPSRSPQEAAVLPVAQAAPDSSVYLFIFDEWSYRRTYAAGQVRTHLRNLAELSRQAITFENAHSPGPKTVASIPAVLRGTADLPEIHGMTPGFLNNGTFVHCSKYPSIFARAGCTGYRKIMIQWGFAISHWIADELDSSRAYSTYPRGDDWLTQAGLHWYNAAFFWTDRWSVLAYEKLKRHVRDAYTLQLYSRMREDVMTIIREDSGHTFAVAHLPIPHPPYLLDWDGNYRPQDPMAYVTANADGYERNLVCMDRLVGQIVSELKAAHRFDSSLIIMTSDHSWRQDPSVPEPDDDELTHVPLIVKLPGQTVPQRVDDEFRTCRLGEFIKGALDSRSPAPAFAARREK